MATLYELNRRWRRVESRSVVGTFPATNLSLTIIFPEKALVKGQFVIHIFEDDMWLYNLIISIFVVTMMGLVVSAIFCIAFVSCLKCCFIRLERDPPRCLERWIDPIPRDYAFYTKRKTIREQAYAGGQLLFGQEACIICLEGFVEGEIIATLGCEHVFHCDCVKNWVDKKTSKSQLCPVCNRDIRQQGDKKKPVPPNQTRLEPIPTETDHLRPREEKAESEMAESGFGLEDSVAGLNQE